MKTLRDPDAEIHMTKTYALLPTPASTGGAISEVAPPAPGKPGGGPLCTGLEQAPGLQPTHSSDPSATPHLTVCGFWVVRTNGEPAALTHRKALLLCASVSLSISGEWVRSPQPHRTGKKGI